MKYYIRDHLGWHTSDLARGPGGEGGGGDGGATVRLVVDKEGIDGAIFSLYVITSQVSLF